MIKKEIKRIFSLALGASVIWLCIIFVLAFMAAVHDPGNVDISLFILILFVAGFMPLLPFWGMIWMKAVKNK
jgi:hypothetical protein